MAFGVFTGAEGEGLGLLEHEGILAQVRAVEARYGAMKNEDPA